jgi:thiamine biosynthesis protein ThiS
MNVKINGEQKDIPDGLTVGGLLEFLGRSPDRVAIECNLKILPRGVWKETRVQPGDAFEIVHLVGGG